MTLLGEPTAMNGREMRWGRRGSLALCLRGERRGLFHDHERGHGGDLLHLIARERRVGIGAAMTIAEREYLRVAPRPPHAAPCGPACGEGARTQNALTLWKGAAALRETPGERYFIDARKLDVRRLDLHHVLRWHGGQRCLVALMTDVVSGAPAGVHRTYVDQQANKLGRKMLGHKGVIRLSPDEDVTLGLGLTEGVEDGLAVLLCGWAPVWAAADAGSIARFPVLSGVESLTLFADRDDAGLNAAQACAARWIGAGREARIVPPKRAVPPSTRTPAC